MSEITEMVGAIRALEEAKKDPNSKLNQREAQKQWECEPCINPEVRDLLFKAFPDLSSKLSGLKGLPPCEGFVPMRVCKLPELPPPRRRRKKKERKEAENGGAEPLRGAGGIQNG